MGITFPHSPAPLKRFVSKADSDESFAEATPIHWDIHEGV